MALLLLGEVQPDLHDDRALARQHGLESRRAVHGHVEVALGDVLEDALDDGPRVPGPHEDRAAAGGGQGPPIAPILGTLLFLVGLVAVGLDLQAPRVHPLEEQPRHLGLAAPLDAADQDEQAELGRGQGLLGLEQVRAQALQALLVGLLVHGVADFRALEHEVVS